MLGVVMATEYRLLVFKHHYEGLLNLEKFTVIYSNFHESLKWRIGKRMKINFLCKKSLHSNWKGKHGERYVPESANMPLPYVPCGLFPG